MQIPRVCQQCAKPFEIEAHRLKRGDGKYCSRACHFDARRTKIACICRKCGAQFFEKPARIRVGKGKYCSRACHKATQSNTVDAFWPLVKLCEHQFPCPYCCWEWSGPRNTDGYGRLTLCYVPYTAHRMAWELWNKRSIPEALFCCHYCHKKLCCNPMHLHVGTAQDNRDDSARDGRIARGRQTNNTKLVEADIVEIFRLYNSGKPKRAIARHYQMSSQAIRAILTRKSWVHVSIPS